MKQQSTLFSQLIILMLCTVFFAGASSNSWAQVVTDGTLDAGEGYTLQCLQDNETGFGNSTSGDPLNAAGGSEINGAYAKIENNLLCLMLTGNLESNFNKLEIFIDSRAGGQNTIMANNPSTDNPFEDVNFMAGITFDAGFEADYWYCVTNGNTPTVLAVYYTELGAGAPMGTTALPDETIVLDGSYPLVDAANTGGSIGINNANIDGVSDAAVGNPGAVTTGVELCIPLSAIGNPSPSDDIKVTAFVNGASHDYLSNQVICGLGGGQGNPGQDGQGTGGLGQGNFALDFGSYSGDQFFTVSATSSTNDLFAASSTLTLSPNPTNNQLRVVLATELNLAETSTLAIYSATGQLLAEKSIETRTGANEYQLDVSDYTQGLYFLTISNSRGIINKKFTKR